MGTDTLSIELTPVDDPHATPYGVASDNNRSPGVFNGVFQKIYNRGQYALNRLAELIGSPIAIAGISSSTDKVTTTSAHGLSAGDVVRFAALNGGSLPAELDGVAVFVLADTSTTFKVAATSGGSAIDITSAGSGDLYVYKVPDLLALLFTNSGAGIQGALTDLFVTVGSSQTISAAKILLDFTLGGSAYVKLASRSITRALACHWVDVSTALAYRTPATIPAGKTIQSGVDLPHGQTVTAIAVTIDPANVLALPGTMPKVTLVKVDSTGTTTEIGFKVDDSGDETIFSALHTVTISGLSEVIDTENNSYRIDVRGSSDDTVVVYRVRATATVTGMRGWA